MTEDKLRQENERLLKKTEQLFRENERIKDKQVIVLSWIGFIVFTGLMIYASTEDGYMVLDNLFQKALAIGALVYIACLIVRKFSK